MTKTEYEFKTPQEALAQLVEDCGFLLTAAGKAQRLGLKGVIPAAEINDLCEPIVSYRLI